MASVLSHLFSISLAPMGEDSFNTEYLLQMDFGWNIPHWMMVMLVLDSIKGMFLVVQPFFNAREGSNLDKFLKDE